MPTMKQVKKMDADTCRTLIKKIKNIKHPAINHTLYDLRILNNIALNDETIEITVTFPFPNIPIADQIINSICNPLKENKSLYS